MTLEQQVHQQELKIQALQKQVQDLQKAVANLAKDSHPPVDFIDRTVEAINSGELKLVGREMFGFTEVTGAIRKYPLPKAETE